MIRWSKRTDFLSIRLPFVLFVLYLLFVQLLKKPFSAYSHIVDTKPFTSCDIYLWMQYITFIFVCTITAFYFEETFRKAPAQYIGVLRPGVLKTVVNRWLCLLILLEVLYLPFIALSVKRINSFIVINGFIKDPPLLNMSMVICQCAVAMLFYITFTMFLTALFKSRVYTLVFSMALCALEATVIPVIMGDYALFRGAFNSADFHCYLMPNNIIMLILSAIFVPAAILLYNPGKMSHAHKSTFFNYNIHLK